MFYSVSLQQILSPLKSIRISFCCFWPHVLIGKNSPTSTWSRNSKCRALDRWSCLHMFLATGNMLHPWPAVPLLVNCRYYKAFSLTEVSVLSHFYLYPSLCWFSEQSPRKLVFSWHCNFVHICSFPGPLPLFLDSRELASSGPPPSLVMTSTGTFYRV